MKKLLKPIFILVMLACIAISNSVYATSLECNIEIKTDKKEYTKGDEFIATAYISDIKSEKGVIALEAVLEYDKNDLTLIEMNGKNTWDTPTNNVSYNESTGKMALTRNSLGKSDEIIFEMKFKVKSESASTTSIKLKDITVANGSDTPKSISLAQKELTIKATNTPPPASDDDGKDNNNPNTPDTNKPDTNKPDANKPDTNTPDTNKPDTNKPDTNKPDTNKPDTNKPDTNKPDTNNNKDNNKNNTNTNNNKNNTNTNKSNTNSNTNKITTTGSTSDNTVKTGSIPKAGIISNPWFIVLIIAVIGSATYFYVKIKFIDKNSK